MRKAMDEYIMYYRLVTEGLCLYHADRNFDTFGKHYKSLCGHTIPKIGQKTYAEAVFLAQHITGRWMVAPGVQVQAYLSGIFAATWLSSALSLTSIKTTDQT